MNQPFYNFSILNQALRFDFLSVGKKVVPKSILYTKTEISNLYSLALVDVYNDGSSDDICVSNNGDMEKILVTVFQTFSIFFTNYPDSIIAFQGSTPSRTRLYRIAISHELANINKVYNVWGIAGEIYRPFEKDHNYTGFLFSLKTINIG
ncbi:MAG: hypothetical protein WKF97_24260 [Chitinophagaceae bacterium]